MGDNKGKINTGLDARRAYLNALISDVRALDILFEENLIASDKMHIGAEQEFSLVESNFRPSPKAPELLKYLKSKYFTSELARFNLEINLDPKPFTGSGISELHKDLIHHVNFLREKSADLGIRPIFTGILPSIRNSDLTHDFMTPEQRYYSLNHIMRKKRGEDFRIFIKGVDELNMAHDNILVEACNTSFQVHLQIEPDSFRDKYNWAQALSGPVLAACTNSPLLLENELWMETRIAVFQQSCDVRQVSNALRKKQARVAFGFDWLYGGMSDLIKENIAKYNLLLTREIKANAMKELAGGKAPRLEALCLHNGTVYKWNRACYGSDGIQPHIRIENRYIPSGPSLVDEIANLTFWIGLMNGMPEEAHEIWKRFDFVDAKGNFFKAARNGLDSRMIWFGDGYDSAALILDTLLPLSYTGLEKAGIDKKDAEFYLGVIKKRVSTRKTGSSWMVRTYRNMKKSLTEKEATMALTKAMHEWQVTGKPVHEWNAPEDVLDEVIGNYERVDELMTVNLITLHEDDLADLALNIMQWQKIRHIPVEDHEGKLIGLLTKRGLEKKQNEKLDLTSTPVSEVMICNPHIIHPESAIEKAIFVMRTENLTCLPVVQNDKLVGILTDYDILRVIDKIDPEYNDDSES